MYFLIYKGIEKINNKEKEWFCLFNDSNLYTKRPLFVWKSKNELQKLSIWGLKFEKGTIIYEGYKEKDIPIVKLPYEKVTLKDRMKLVLVRKRKDFTDNKRFLVVTSTCAYEYLSYQEVLYYNQKYGFTNIVKGDIIKTVKGEIPVEEPSEYTIEEEAKVINIVSKNDKTFRDFIDNNHIFESLKNVNFDFRDKRSLRDVALFGDSGKLMDAVEKFYEKPFMNFYICKPCFDVINRLKKENNSCELINSEIAEDLLNNIRFDFLIYPCKYCESVQNLYRFSVMEKRKESMFGDGLRGMVSTLAPYDIVFNKKTINQDLEGMYIVFHEYSHYLSCKHGNNGFIINDSYKKTLKYSFILNDFYKLLSLNNNTITKEGIDKIEKSFFNFLTEGLTEIIAGYLLYIECKEKMKEGIYFYNKNEECKDIAKIRYIYSYPSKDLKVIESIDSLFKKSEDMKNKEFEIYLFLSPYYKNIQFVLLLSKKLGLSFVVDCYFNNRPDLLWGEIKNKIPNIMEVLNIFYNTYLEGDVVFEDVVIQKLIDVMGLNYNLIPIYLIEDEEILEDIIDVSEEIFDINFINS